MIFVTVIVITLYNWEKVIKCSRIDNCFDLDSALSKKYTLVFSNTRELNRVPKYKTSTLYTKL